MHECIYTFLYAENLNVLLLLLFILIKFHRMHVFLIDLEKNMHHNNTQQHFPPAAKVSPRGGGATSSTTTVTVTIQQQQQHHHHPPFSKYRHTHIHTYCNLGLSARTRHFSSHFCYTLVKCYFLIVSQANNNSHQMARW